MRRGHAATGAHEKSFLPLADVTTPRELSCESEFLPTQQTTGSGRQGSWGPRAARASPVAERQLKIRKNPDTPRTSVSLALEKNHKSPWFSGSQLTRPNRGSQPPLFGGSPYVNAIFQVPREETAARQDGHDIEPYPRLL